MRRRRRASMSLHASALPPISNLQRRFGCSDTTLASCLHPQVKLSSIAPSLSRQPPPRALRSILRSSIVHWSNPNPVRKSSGRWSHQVEAVVVIPKDIIRTFIHLLCLWWFPPMAPVTNGGFSYVEWAVNELKKQGCWLSPSHGGFPLFVVIQDARRKTEANERLKMITIVMLFVRLNKLPHRSPIDKVKG